jgi:ParB/RepB/Spo0J family partition protein
MTKNEERLETVPIGELERNAAANIRHVDTKSDAFKELVASVKMRGILEPPLARHQDGKTRLIAGFRRLAAARLAGLKEIPVRIVEVDGTGVTEVQLLENMQRENLTPLEEAKAMKSYLDASKSTQEQLGKRIGKSQSYVANRIRLLNLPDAGVKLIESGKISASAAELLASLPEDAQREAKRAFAELERKGEYRGGVTVQEAKWAAETAMRSYRGRKKKERAIAAAKFPKCPVKSCGKAGHPLPEWDSREGFVDSGGHRWSTSTGKLLETERRNDAVYNRTPPKPTLPEVDPKVVLSVPGQLVANRILEAIKGVEDLRLEWRSGTRASLQLDVDLPALKAAKVPALELGANRKFVEVEAANDWCQRDDRGRKEAAKARSDLEAWLLTVRAVGRPTKEPAGTAATLKAAPRARGRQKSGAAAAAGGPPSEAPSAADLNYGPVIHGPSSTDAPAAEPPAEAPPA